MRVRCGAGSVGRGPRDRGPFTLRCCYVPCLPCHAEPAAQPPPGGCTTVVCSCLVVVAGRALIVTLARVRGAAAALFIAGQFPLEVLTYFKTPSQYTSFDSALKADRSEHLPTGAVDDAHWWLKYAVVGNRAGLVPALVPVEFMHSSFVAALIATRLQEGLEADLMDLATTAATYISTFSLPGRTCSERPLTERIQAALTAMFALHEGIKTRTSVTSPASSPPLTASTADAASADSPRRSSRKPSTKSTDAGGESADATDKPSDGSFKLDSGGFGAHWLVHNTVGTLDRHSGMQNDVYAILHAPFTDGKGEPFNSGSAAGTLHVPVVLLQHVPGQPCFMLNVYGGQLLELRVAAWAGPTLCSTVIATAPLHSCSGPGYDQLVSLLFGLAVGVRALCSCYNRARTAALTDRRVVPLPVPHLHELIHRDVLARVVSPDDTLHLTAHIQPNVFRGLLRRGSAAPTAAAGAAGSGEPTPMRVIVKFASSYSRAVHDIVAAAERAPQLHSCVKLGSWSVGVMDELPAEGGWRHLHDASVPASAVDVVLAEYRRVFVNPATGRRLVHGDARGPNILVRCTPCTAAITASDVRFVDFEYAGEEGVARFPANASKAAYEPVLHMLALERGCWQVTLAYQRDEALIRSAGARRIASATQQRLRPPTPASSSAQCGGRGCVLRRRNAVMLQPPHAAGSEWRSALDSSDDSGGTLPAPPRHPHLVGTLVGNQLQGRQMQWQSAGNLQPVVAGPAWTRRAAPARQAACSCTHTRPRLPLWVEGGTNIASDRATVDAGKKASHAHDRCHAGAGATPRGEEVNNDEFLVSLSGQHCSTGGRARRGTPGAEFSHRLRGAEFMFSPRSSRRTLLKLGVRAREVLDGGGLLRGGHLESGGEGSEIGQKSLPDFFTGSRRVQHSPGKPPRRPPPALPLPRYDCCQHPPAAVWGRACSTRRGTGKGARFWGGA